MLTVGVVVKLQAKPEKAADLREFLTQALPLAEAEPGTPIWLAVETDATTFWIVDAFPGVAERQAHLEGAIAEQLLARADDLLSAPPEIMMSTILGAKPATVG